MRFALLGESARLGEQLRGDRRGAAPGRGTVKTHVRRVLTKLGVRDRVHAVVFAFDHGLVRAAAEQ
ncbi:hypothetical protein GCM10010195_27710 [Kitasatospora griseola]|nr:hypothetical protein GCM10010195_27710 [Kitasatospora griseola]